MADPSKDIEPIFNEALQITNPSRRNEFLDKACGGNQQLRDRIEELLQAAAGAGDFLSTPVPITVDSSIDPAKKGEVVDITADSAGATGPTRLSNPSAPGFPSAQVTYGDNPALEKVGTRVGPYKLLQVIGEGGFGTVYLAEQDQPVRRRVALKLIKLGMDTRQVIARFEQERQALAMMDHPNIAKVLDAGATETGRPYFVMELVKGVPITQYCDANSLTPSQRLDLFTSVCYAVQHAHQKGIIHRDIKPSNVLVSRHDDKPVVKIIDFGIAKATNARITEKTVFTELHHVVGTPAYMSPEQAGLSDLDIDTRSDVYSLGVLLYELLTGTTPFELRSLLSKGYAEIQRIIREEDPPKPSTRLSGLKDSLPSIAASRKTEPTRLTKLVRGDLDWIVMKCLEKDRTRRYETANDLAADIQRYLNREAVVAAPPSRAYRARKFVGRHRTPVAAGALVALAIFIGTGLAIAGFVQARKQRDLAMAAEGRAVAEAQSSKQIADFLVTMLKGAGPEVALGRDATLLREIVDKTSERVEKELADQPLVASRILRIISEVYNALAVYDKSEQSARRSLELLRSIPEVSPVTVARALVEVAKVLESTDRYDEAKATYQESYDMYVGAGEGDSEDALTALSGVGGVLFHVRDNNGAESVFRKVLEKRKALASGRDSEQLASAIDRLSVAASRNQSDLTEAEALAREALAMRRRLFGEVHPDVTLSLSNLASILSQRQKFDEAIDLGKQSVEQHRHLFGDRHPRTASALDELSWVYKQAGRLPEAIPLARLALEINTENLGPDARTTINSHFGLGTMLDATKDFAGAEKQYRALMNWGRANYPKGDNRTSAVTMLVANAVMNQKRYADAEALYREVLDARLANLPPGHPQITETRNALANNLIAQGRHAEAEPLLLAVESQSQMTETPPKARAAVLNQLIKFYEGWIQDEPDKGHDKKADEWRAKLKDFQESKGAASSQPTNRPSD